MLTQLSIRNILLLKACDIPFAGGLNVLTGETGAGKSILLDALGLALGERSDASLVRAGENQASVTAEFQVAGHAALHALLEELSLPISDEIILRRTLQSDGKSRAFVNDEPVSVTALKRIGELLVARHGQHDQRGLLDSKTHRALLDDAAGNVGSPLPQRGRGLGEGDSTLCTNLTAPSPNLSPLGGEGYAGARSARAHKNQSLLNSCATAFRAMKDAIRQRDELHALREQAAREEAWLRQTVDELGALSPRAGEEGELLDLRRRANQSKQAMAHLQQALEALTANEGVTLALRQAAKSLLRAGGEELPPIIAALERAENEAEEALVALERLVHAREIDPHELEAAEDRLHALRDAARKFNSTVEALADHYEDARKKLATIDHNAEQEKRIQAVVEQTRAEYLDIAAKLHASREKAAKQLVKQVEAELKPLKMGSTKLRVAQVELPESQWGEAGIHNVSFEVATNEGMPFGALSKVASGGELSRLLLAMKVTLNNADTPCQIFDEIDAGTGGAVAEAIGVRLRALSASAQVLVVTHLPQVAAQASHHLFISKSGGKAVATTVRPLDARARKEELARMMSGETITDEARNAAGKLIQAAV